MLLHPEAHILRFGTKGQNRLLPIQTRPYRGYLIAIRPHNETTNGNYACEWSDSTTGIEYENEPADDMLGTARLTLHKTTFTTYDVLRKREHQELPEFEGVVSVHNDTLFIKRISRYMRTRRHIDTIVPDPPNRHQHHHHATLIMLKRSDHMVPKDSIPDSNKTHMCGTTHGDVDRWLDEVHSGVLKSNGLLKRDVTTGSCPTSSKILYMSVAMDCTYIQVHGGEQRATEKVIENWNKASEVFEKLFNIYLGIISIVPFQQCGSEPFNVPCSNSYTISSRLSDFSYWRGTTRDNSAGLWHLMSNCSSNATIGIAWLGRLCQTTKFTQTVRGVVQHVSGTGISTVVNDEWLVVAHEIGHNFGAKHDCISSMCSCTGTNCETCCKCGTSCDCRGAYIMNPTNNIRSKDATFSPCSQDDICKVNSVIGTCLQTPGTRKILNGGICGNGIREGNEQCDCGDKCSLDKCCTANCTLKLGAACSDTNDACCANCQVIDKSVGKVCRPARSECDIEETCGGDALCPKDLYIKDGTTCGANSTYKNLKCSSGVCANRDLQCILMGGSDVTGECPGYQGQCAMFCKSSIEGCTKIGDRYLDGTECGNGGQCIQGKCTNPDFFGMLIEWILANQTYAIVIGVGVLSLFLAILYRCSHRCRPSVADKKAKLAEAAAKLKRREEEREQKEQEALERRSQGSSKPPSSEQDSSFDHDNASRHNALSSQNYSKRSEIHGESSRKSPSQQFDRKLFKNNGNDDQEPFDHVSPGVSRQKSKIKSTSNFQTAKGKDKQHKGTTSKGNGRQGSRLDEIFDDDV